MSINKKDFLSGVCEKYPEELLEGRLTTEGNFLGCIVLDLLKLDEYKFDISMFITRDGRFYYSLFNDLRAKGIATLDEVSILTNSKETVVERYNELGGWETLESMASCINLNNWDAYMDKLYKSNVILSLWNDGYNVLKDIQYNDKKVNPLKLFAKLSAEQVVEFYEAKLSSLNVGESSYILEEGNVDFSDEWINTLEEAPDCGVSYETVGLDCNGKEIEGLGMISRQTLGLHRSNLAMIGAASSVGKSSLMVTFILAMLSQGEKVLVISTEEDKKAFMIKFMVFILAKYNHYYSLTKSKLTAGTLTEEDKRQINIARKYFNDNYKDQIKFISIEDMNMGVIKKKTREYALKWGCSAIFLDTYKIQSADFGSVRQDLALVRDSRELHNLCRKYNLIGLASVQLSMHTIGTLNLTSASISNSKGIVEILDIFLTMRILYNSQELDPKNKNYCHPFKLVKTNDKWIEEEVKLDEDAVYRVISLSKNRYGQDANGNNVSYIVRFDGAHTTFKIVACCKPAYGQIQ